MSQAGSLGSLCYPHPHPTHSTSPYRAQPTAKTLTRQVVPSLPGLLAPRKYPLRSRLKQGTMGKSWSPVKNADSSAPNSAQPPPTVPANSLLPLSLDTEPPPRLSLSSSVPPEAGLSRPFCVSLNFCQEVVTFASRWPKQIAEPSSVSRGRGSAFLRQWGALPSYMELGIISTLSEGSTE